MQAMKGDEQSGQSLLPVSSTIPEDVRLLRDILRKHRSVASARCTYNVANCGTAMRFLTAYFAQQIGSDVVLTGCERMLRRPIGQLVETLRQLGAEIDYLGEEGYPPLHIVGRKLNRISVRIDNPLSTQFVSALLLIGAKVETNSTSPYIEMTRRLIADYPQGMYAIESDWSAAAFWYEYVALYGGELRLEGLHRTSLQGDSIVADIYAGIGVETTYESDGICIRAVPVELPSSLHVDFSACPDLYPAVAITCERLAISLVATGIETLCYKESNRIEAVARHEVRGDHRMAMALLVAGVPCDDKACISKSYPNFYEQWTTLRRSWFSHIVPIRGVNDDCRGKKHALYKLIQAADTEWVWLHDDDIIPPAATDEEALLETGEADLLILPLRMRVEHSPLLLERLQIAEYAAIQQITIETARRGHAVMCSGANMIVRRQRWLESYEDIHSEIPSGDDMFLLESFKRRGLKIAVSTNPRMEATVAPLSSWRLLIRQRMRWAGKTPAYRDRDILLCGALIGLTNLLQIVCPLLMLLKFPLEYTLIKRREPDTSLWIALLLEVVYPYYMLVSLLGGIYQYTKQVFRPQSGAF